MSQNTTGLTSIEGTGFASVQSTRRKKGSGRRGTNKVLSSPGRAHDPRKRVIKLPPSSSATGLTQDVDDVTITNTEDLCDPNLEFYKDKPQRSRSRSETPPGSPSGFGSEEEITEPEPSKEAEVVAASNDQPMDYAKVVKGHKGGSQWPALSKARDKKAMPVERYRAPSAAVQKRAAVFDRNKLSEEIGAAPEQLPLSEGMLGEAFEPLADYAVTSLADDICEIPIDKNPILMKAVNPSEGVSNDKVTYSDMKFMVEAVVKPNPLLPKQILKDLKIPKNLKNFMREFSTLVDKTAAMGSSHAFKLTPSGIKTDKGVPIYFYTVSMSSSEGRDNLLAYKWTAKDMIMRYVVEFVETKTDGPMAPPGVWFRVPLAQTKDNLSNPPPLSQYVNCLATAGLEIEDVMEEFHMGYRPGETNKNDSKVFEDFLYFKLKPESCENHGSTQVVTIKDPNGDEIETRIPATPINYPPPNIVVVDFKGVVHVRPVQKLGDFCRHCLGEGQCVKDSCLYFGRCRACMVMFKDMKNNGKRHFCIEGMESIPENAKPRDEVSRELQPERKSAKRQKRNDKIAAGALEKRNAELAKALAAYSNAATGKEEGQLP